MNPLTSKTGAHKHLYGTLTDIQTNSIVTGVRVELWFKGEITEMLVGSEVSDGDGRFCFVVDRYDAEQVGTHSPFCNPNFFVKVLHDGTEKVSEVSFENEPEEPSEIFKFPVNSTDPQMEVRFKSTDQAYDQVRMSFRLVDTAEAAMGRFPVSAELNADGKKVLDLGTATSSERGYFTMSYALTPQVERALDGAVISVDFIVYEPGTQNQHDTASHSFPSEPDYYQTFDIEVDPIPEVDTSQTISDLTTEIGLTLSTEVSNHLTTNNIDSLKDLRAAGFIDPEEFTADPDKAAVKKLNSHGRLEPASSDALLRDFYIDAGYESMKMVAKAMRHDFVDQGKSYEDANELEKATFHRIATAQQKVLENILAGAKVGIRGAFKNSDYKDTIGGDHGAYCNCKDCEAATSPLAYLADLLKYTTEHVYKGNSLVTIGGLKEDFCQPFGDLPADCEEMSKKICQYRIAVEILRCQYEAGTDCQVDNLAEAEARYRNSAYFMLLDFMGTSYDELRQANAVTENREEELTSITDRIGIHFWAEPPIVNVVHSGEDRFIIRGNYSATLARAGVIEIQGSTSNDGIYPLSSSIAPLYEPATNTTTVVVSTPIPNLSEIEGVARIDVLAAMFLDVEAEPAENDEDALESIFGLRNSHRGALEDQPEPEVTHWQLAYFRQQSENEDHPNDPYSNGELPIIDPDLIGVDDLRNPGDPSLFWVNPEDPDNDPTEPQYLRPFALPLEAYNLWEDRRSWLDETVLSGVFHASSSWTDPGTILGDRQFKISGEYDEFLVEGSLIKVHGSTANDGFYTVRTSSSDSNETSIDVAEIIPDTTADGVISFLRNYAIMELETGSSGNGLFRVSGNRVAEFPVGLTFGVTATSSNRGQFTVDDTIALPTYDAVTKLTTIRVSETVNEGQGLGRIFIEEMVNVESPVLVTNDKVNVKGDSSDFDTLNNPIPFTITGCGENDGEYTVLGATSPSPEGTIEVTVSEHLSSLEEGGQISFSQQRQITGIELGERQLTVGEYNLTPFILASTEFHIVGSSGNNGEYHASADAVLVGGDTQINTSEAIASAEANGSVRLEFNIDAVNGDTITVNNADFTGILSQGDTVVINQAAGGEVSYTVSTVTLNGSHCDVELVDLSSGTAAASDDLYLAFAITDVNLSGKHFTTGDNDLNRFFVGDQITAEDTGDPLNDKTYTVESVSYEGTSTKVYVDEYINSTTYGSGYLKIHRVLPIRISTPNVDTLFTYMQGLPLDSTWLNADPALFSDIAADLSTGINVEAHTEYIETDVKLTVDAFQEMVRISQKDADYRSGINNEVVTDEEWSDFINILVSAVKKNKHAQWLSEEAGDSIILDPKTFWKSQRQPKEGAWPMANEFGVPLIDPELVSLSDLPEGLAGNAAINTYNSRATELEEVKTILSNGSLPHSQDIIQFVFGVLLESDDSVESLYELQSDLNSIDASTSEAAQSVVENNLNLAVEDFQVLMDIFSRMNQQGYAANDEDREFYIPLLLTSYKESRLYPIWLNEEAAENHFNLRKAQLPRWRANAQQRAVWQNALKERSQIPTVDPDLVFAEDFLTYVVGEPGYEAYQLWEARRTELEDLVASITGITNPNDQLELQNRIKEVLALTDFSEFQEIEELQALGVNVKKRLKQLGLTPTAYRRLMGLHELAGTSDDALLDSEKEEAVAILLNVLKRRTYATWKDEEAGLGVTLSQDFFKVNKDQFYNYSIVLERLKKYRATYKERRNWTRTLEGRIENVEKAAEAQRTVVRQTEEQVLPFLRDALIQASGDNDHDLETNAQAFNDRYLFDFKVNCCQEVTRVSQAIETLQQILWTERTRTDESNELNLELKAPDFDEEWKWIGSYANWRSAMFVFLFPENLLYPTLRRNQSHGFTELTKTLRGNARITPEMACHEAHKYTEYLRDVCNLKVQATCTAKTVINLGDCESGFTTNYKCLFYVFAIAQNSGKTYMSIGNGDSLNIDGQDYWQPVEAFSDKVEKIIGAVPWKHYQTTGEQHIYVFAIVKEKGERVLAYARYNLETRRWDDEEFETLTLPENVGNLHEHDIVIQQRNSLIIPPRFIVKRAFNHSDEDAEVKFPSFNDLTEELEWYREDWPILAKIIPYTPEVSQAYQLVTLLGGTFTPGSGMSRILAETKMCAHHLKHDHWWHHHSIFENDGEFYIHSTNFGNFFGAIKLRILDPDHNNVKLVFAGSSMHPHDSDQITVFYRMGNSDSVIRQFRLDFSTISNFETYATDNHSVDVSSWQNVNGWNGDAIWNVIAGYRNYVTNNVVIGNNDENLEPFTHGSYVAPNWGIGESPNPYKSEQNLNALQMPSSYGAQIKRFDMAAVIGSDPLQLKPLPWSIAPITPNYNGPFDSVHQLDGDQLQAHRNMVRQAVDNNWDLPQLCGGYMAEMFYFMPMYIGLQLQARGHYTEALDWYRTVYDYRQSDYSKRKIYRGLELEESIGAGYQLSEDWLHDPLNPHQLAATRANSYTKYTLLSIIRCLEDYADAEFTIDTAETVPRAKELYQEALELLQLDDLLLLEDQCHCDSKTDDILRRISCELSEEQLEEWQWAIELREDELQRITDCTLSDAVLDDIVDWIIANPDTPGAFDLDQIIEDAIDELEQGGYILPTNKTISEVITYDEEVSAEIMDSIQSTNDVETANREVATLIERDFLRTVVHITGILPENADADSYAYLSEGSDSGELPEHFLISKQTFPEERWQNPEHPTPVGTMNLIGNKLPNSAGKWVADYPEGVYVPVLSHFFCVPDNPVIRGLRLRAELNLFKIRNCMNIAGMTRSLDPYAAPTDTTSGVPVIGPGGQLSLPGSARIKPTPYRYEVIVDRAKQLVSYAQQIEANFLAALEKRDAEYYNRMKAKQDLSLGKANVKLQRLRVKVAEGEVDMAELQRDRAQLQILELQAMIDDGLLGQEQALEGLYTGLAVTQAITEAASFTLQAATATIGMGAAIASAAIATTSSIIQSSIQASINITQLYASQARREQEWRYQQNLANHDVQIGNQGIRVAQSRLRVAGQEQKISELQVDHAEATVDFLTNKFTNVALYDFMSETLEGVYSYFLQQATATAKMAMNQLAFERQELPPAFIVDDYWQVPTDSAAVATVGSNAPDRRGLTGSARLLQDITKLDTYSFDTDKRRLQMSKTFSLSSLSPVEFQQFKDTGVINFETMMEYFDRDFPGHYLRLIKKVKVNVIALTPPTDGIKATLTSSGTSRVVIGGDLFQTIVARRDPEVIALTGTRDATGMFEMQADNQFLNPFEGSGVHMLWEFKMAKEANLFNYDTIADVLITIDYTAFHDYNYQQQVIRQLPPFHSADRPFSFRSELADQFYEMGHPDEELPGDPTVEFTLSRGDFPPNIEYITTKEFKMLFVTRQGETIDLSNLPDLQFSFEELDQEEGGFQVAVTPPASIGSNNLITTTSGNGGLASDLRNKSPFGRWRITIPQMLSEKIRNEEVVDIMMVFTYSGDYPMASN